MTENDVIAKLMVLVCWSVGCGSAHNHKLALRCRFSDSTGISNIYHTYRQTKAQAGTETQTEIHRKDMTHRDTLTQTDRVNGPSVPVSCTAISQCLDKDAKFFKTSISADAHTNDTQTETFVTCTYACYRQLTAHTRYTTRDQLTLLHRSAPDTTWIRSELPCNTVVIHHSWKDKEITG